MLRFLIDTSIWIDLYENRIGYEGEPLGEYAMKLFLKILNKKDVIIISDLLLKELKINYSLEEINGMMKIFETSFEQITSTKTNREYAKKIAKDRNLPAGDALHAILAKEYNLILITRDKHFKQLTDIREFFKPENFIYPTD